MSVDNNPVYVSLEFTPNPNTLKYVINRELLKKGAANFTQASEAKDKSPLAEKLFEVSGICGVMIGKDFVTVTKDDAGDWDSVHQSASNLIERHISAGESVLASDFMQVETPTGQTEAEQKIIQIINDEIRPAVAMDGGDITFEKYEDGVVYLYLQGSCSGCPSATMTLKVGIENRLKQVVPEIKEVVSV